MELRGHGRLDRAVPVDLRGQRACRADGRARLRTGRVRDGFRHAAVDVRALVAAALQLLRIRVHHIGAIRYFVQLPVAAPLPLRGGALVQTHARVGALHLRGHHFRGHHFRLPEEHLVTVAETRVVAEHPVLGEHFRLAEEGHVIGHIVGHRRPNFVDQTKATVILDLKNQRKAG